MKGQGRISLALHFAYMERPSSTAPIPLTSQATAREWSRATAGRPYDRHKPQLMSFRRRPESGGAILGSGLRRSDDSESRRYPSALTDRSQLSAEAKPRP